MKSFHDTQELAECLCDYVDGSMEPRERSAFERQLRNSPEVRERLAKYRAMQRVLKVARTIADLAGEPDIAACHVAEAIAYRRLIR